MASGPLDKSDRPERTAVIGSTESGTICSRCVPMSAGEIAKLFGGAVMGWPTGKRCEDGRLMRRDPQPDDPWLETDMGECPECNGKGCDGAPDDHYPDDDPDDWTDEDEAALERYEENRRARIEWDNYHPGVPCPDIELPHPPERKGED